MSILSQFFEGRHKEQASKDKNETLVSIFSSTFQAPQPHSQSNGKTKTIVKEKKAKKKQTVQQSESQQENQPKRSNKKVIKPQIEQEEEPQEENVKKIQKKKNKKAKEGKAKEEKEQQREEKVLKVPEEKQQQPENLDSTIFVGNVPLASTHKSIKKYFQKFGKVLKVWFRSIPVEESKIPKKGLHILKKYQEGADSMNAYVKFQQQSEAAAACEANGDEIEGKNIRVTLCNEYNLDYETTIFIGNLPKKIKDQELWDAFKGVGKVKSVRVIRKKESMEGIGIGYVRFETKEEMKKAISEMNGKNLGDRPMRIKKAVSKERLEKKVRKIKQNKEKKFKKSLSTENTGKGTEVRRERDQPGQLRNQGLKNTMYNKKKPINKDFNKFKSAAPQNRRPFPKDRNEPASEPAPRPSNDVIRTKFGFAGKKIILQ